MTAFAPVLIIGKNGKTGSRVNALLQARGIATRAVSRSTTPAFDWNEPDTWAAALDGIKQAYVTYHPDLAVPGAEPALRAFVDAAREHGVEHLADRLFELTGPELLTFADCVAQISQEVGRPIHYSAVPLEPYMAQLKELGLSDDQLWLLNELFTKVLDGRNSQVAHGVEQALGRPPRRFADYVKAAHQHGAWTASEGATARPAM